MQLLPYLVGWVILTLIVIVLAAYRKSIASHEDDMIHISDASGSVAAQQVQVAKKLEAVDRWGKILTVLALLSGLALAAWYGYLKWMETTAYTG
jgi:hypothetical protein